MCARVYVCIILRKLCELPFLSHKHFGFLPSLFQMKWGKSTTGKNTTTIFNRIKIIYYIISPILLNRKAHLLYKHYILRYTSYD